MPHKSDVQVALISGGTSGIGSHQWQKRKNWSKS